MKIMISQPMGNKTNEQIRAEREEIVQELVKRNCEVIDTIFEEEAPKGTNIPVYYLGKSIKALSKADKVLFMNGWENARGCKIEHEICKQYGMPIITEQEIDDLQEIDNLRLYKERFLHLDKEWNRVVEELLGKEYYNYACDAYTCDTLTADDLIYKYKKSKLKYRLVRALKGE